MSDRAELATAIQNLRTHCNIIIETINVCGAVNVPAFHAINELLKRCDAVFRAFDTDVTLDRASAGEGERGRINTTMTTPRVGDKVYLYTNHQRIGTATHHDGDKCRVEWDSVSSGWYKITNLRIKEWAETPSTPAPQAPGEEGISTAITYLRGLAAGATYRGFPAVETEINKIIDFIRRFSPSADLLAAAKAEFGWVIEHGASEVSRPRYWGGVHGWTYDNLKAVRFAREIDAQSQAGAGAGVPNNYRIKEHGWG